jgi:cysteine desulfurase
MLYADYNATTPVAPEVLEAVTACLQEAWGNSSASYRFGAKLRERVEQARESVARLIGARPDELIFTSGATEANVTALNAATEGLPSSQSIVTTAVEHPSVLERLSQLATRDRAVIRLGVSATGDISLDELRQAVEFPTALVSIMWANNETGVIFPAEAIGRICLARSVPFHCDAVQAVGKIPVSVGKVNASYLSVSAHKIGGPKGVGALYCRSGAKFVPLIPGGHQQEGRRGGTENVPGIVGFGVAADLAAKHLDAIAKHTLKLRTEFESLVKASIPGAVVNGEGASRLPNTTSLTIPGVNADALLMLLDQDGICASTGSACLADSEEPSHVVRAMVGHELNRREVIRISFGSGNTLDEAQQLAIALKRSVSALSASCGQAYDP